VDLAIPTKLDEKLVKALDRLVSEGFYVSRSEAIREGVRKLVAEQYISMQDFLRIIAHVVSETITSQLSHVITDLVLFGSAARGEATLESDIDMLTLIKKEEDSPKIRRKLHEIAYPISLAANTPITFIVMSRGEFVKWVRNKYSFAEEVIKQGIQLHGDALNVVRNRKPP